DPLEEDRLDRGLPRPQAEWIIGQRGVVGVEHERGAALEPAARILLRAPELRGAFDQFGLEHDWRAPRYRARGAFAGKSVNPVTKRESTGKTAIRRRRCATTG